MSPLPQVSSCRVLERPACSAAGRRWQTPDAALLAASSALLAANRCCRRRRLCQRCVKPHPSCLPPPLCSAFLTAFFASGFLARSQWPPQWRRGHHNGQDVPAKRATLRQHISGLSARFPACLSCWRPPPPPAGPHRRNQPRPCFVPSLSTNQQPTFSNIHPHLSTPNNRMSPGAAAQLLHLLLALPPAFFESTCYPPVPLLYPPSCMSALQPLSFQMSLRVMARADFTTHLCCSFLDANKHLLGCTQTYAAAAGSGGVGGCCVGRAEGGWLGG